MNNPPELLFDTTASIDIYRGREEMRGRFEAVLSGELIPYVSAITEAELWRGLRVEELERHEMIIEHFISLPLDSDAARQAGTWMQKYVNICARPMIYLPASEMDSFVREAIEQIQKIYHVLWPVPPKMDGHASALEFSL